MKRELIIGCGHKKTFSCKPKQVWDNPTTIDINPDCKPDLILDLEKETLPFPDNTFDEIHAYEILEHIGQQGDYKLYFKQFEDYWRVLKDGGIMYISVPKWDGEWAWGDPGHKRIISIETLTFLEQDQYKKQIGVTSMTDYRHVYKGDFKLIDVFDMEYTTYYVLRCIK